MKNVLCEILEQTIITLLICLNVLISKLLLITLIIASYTYDNMLVPTKLLSNWH